MRLLALALALAASGCASMPDMKDGGLPLAKSGWRLVGGADFEKQAWFLLFWRPWGAAEKQAAIAADKIVLP
jgi:hypothetical protein